MTKLIRRTATLSLLALGMCLPLSGCAPAEPETETTRAQINPDRDEETMVVETTKNTAVESGARVLRHAVFFGFKDTVRDADIRRVVDALADLPSKIPEIIDIKWGTNNSPEGLDDGFTHCFLLTFADQRGREVYLPHKAHEAFGEMLRPHMEKVFVIDYWGKQGRPSADRELKHAVFLKFKDDAAPEDITKVEQAFVDLPFRIDAIKGFEWGTNNSPETHDAGFTHAFMMTFESEAGRAEYLPHVDHQAFIKVLKPALDKVRVLDFWSQTE